MPGGLVEVEFIAQALTVAHAPEQPRLLRRTTREVLAALGRHGLLEDREAATLIQAERLWRTLLGLMRLTVGKWATPELPATLEAAMREQTAALVHHAVPDHEALRAEISRHAAAVRAAFEHRIGPPGGER
jgi:glutamate-ammonia-ligase adenylyltransferase